MNFEKIYLSIIIKVNTVVSLKELLTCQSARLPYNRNEIAKKY
jgi:hypothetical protein